MTLVQNPDQIPNTCDKCEYSNDDKKVLQEHILTKHCDECDNRSRLVEDLSSQIKTTHQLTQEEESNDLDKVYYNCDKCEYKAGDLTQVETQFMWKQSNIGNAMKRIFSMPTNKTSLPAHNCDLYTKTV